MLNRLITLRPATAGDGQLIADIVSRTKRAGSDGVEGTSMPSRSAIEASIQNSEINYLLVCAKDSEHIGVIEWKWIGDLIARCARVGIVISDTYRWNLGFGAEAIDSALEELFYTYNCHRVEFVTQLSNVPVMKMLARRESAVVDGILRENVYKNGSYQDSVVWSVLRSEFDKAIDLAPDRVSRLQQQKQNTMASQVLLSNYLKMAGSSSQNLISNEHNELPPSGKSA